MAKKSKKGILNKYSVAEKRDFLFVYLLVAFPVLQIAIFWFYINIDSFILAFKDPFGAWTLENFQDVFFAFNNPDKYQFILSELLGRSFLLWFIANCIAFPIGLATTYVLFRKVFGHYVFRIIFLLPGLVGSVVWVSMVKGLAEYNGPIIFLLKNLGVSLNPMVLKQGLFSHESTAFLTICILTFTLGFVGGNVVITGAYSRIPSELYDVGKLDGLGFWREFFKVAIPIIWPTISTLFTIQLCTMFIADGDVFLYSNGLGEPGMATMGYYIYYLVYRISLSTSANLPYGYPAAIGMCITFVTIPIVLTVRWLLDRVSEAVET